jgi:hypothetical protein
MSQFKENLSHLKNHVKYPANKQQLVAACNNMMDVQKDDRDWFGMNLPQGNYNNAEDVLRALLAKV